MATKSVFPENQSSMRSISAAGSIHVRYRTPSSCHGISCSLKFFTAPFPAISRSPFSYKTACIASGSCRPISYLCTSSRPISAVASARISSSSVKAAVISNSCPCSGTCSGVITYSSAGSSRTTWFPASSTPSAVTFTSPSFSPAG